jgi:hypothetical protein
MKSILLASVGALALCAALPGAASADISGTVSGSYANDTNGGGGGLWNVGGSLTDKFAGDWGAEVTGGYHSLGLGDGFGNLDIWNVGGSVFWASMQGRLAATVNYYSTSNDGLNLNVTNYGAGGEWYLGPNFTVAVKGGGDTVNVSEFGGSGNASGGYAGGMLQWYVMPDLSLSGSVDYAELGGLNTTSETAKVEWLFSHSTPISVYGGYEHADSGSNGFGGLGGGDLFFVGLKFYFNGASGGALVDRQRNGSLGYIADTPVLGLSTN